MTPKQIREAIARAEFAPPEVLRVDVASLANELLGIAFAERRAEQQRDRTGRRGRPPRKIDAQILRRLGGIGATIAEAAVVLGVPLRTLEDHLGRDEDLRAAWDSGRAVACASLQRKILAGGPSDRKLAAVNLLGWRVNPQLDLPGVMTCLAAMDPKDVRALVAAGSAERKVADRLRAMERERERLEAELAARRQELTGADREGDIDENDQ